LRPGIILQIPAPIPETVVGAVSAPPLRKPPEKIKIFLQDIFGTQPKDQAGKGADAGAPPAHAGIWISLTSWNRVTAMYLSTLI
jgi:hypothetical protein